MSDYSNAYQVACVPGPKSAAAVTRGPGGSPVLVIYLDPVNMSIHSAPSRELAGFFRELAREAAKFAAEIDPRPDSAADGPRHQRHGGDVR